ncbi:hypothetical protein MMC11_003649 [Xylographa trunciseda]|nr:hypothetical protein [Xylographa trunciseda]
MSVPRSLTGLTSRSIRTGYTHSLPSVIGSDGVESQQNEGSENEEIEYPDVQENQVPDAEQLEGPKAQQDGGLTIQQPEAVNVQQNHNPNVQQLTRRVVRRERGLGIQHSKALKVQDSQVSRTKQTEGTKGQQDGGSTIQQPEDLNVQQNHYPNAQQLKGPKIKLKRGVGIQHLKALEFQDNQVSPPKQTEGRKGQYNGALMIQQPEVPNIQQAQVPPIQQNVAPTAQQVQFRRTPLANPAELKAILEELRPIAERNAPLNRGEGINISQGLDIFNHKKVGPGGYPLLTKLGVLSISLELVRKYDQILGKPPTENEINAAERESADIEIGGLTPLAAPPATQPHVLSELHVEQSGYADNPSNVALELPGNSKQVLVDREYLQRIEKEIALYRYHLCDLEMGAVRRVENGLMDIIQSKPDKKQGRDGAIAMEVDGKVKDKTVPASAMKPSQHKGPFKIILKLRPELANQLPPSKILILRLQPKLLEQLDRRSSAQSQLPPPKILILRVQPKFLEQLDQRSSAQSQPPCKADRKRVLEDSDDAQAAAEHEGVVASNEKAANDAKEELHVDKKMRLEEELVV